MNDFASDEDFMAVMLGEFLDESEGQLSRLNENLLVLDELVSAVGNAEAAEPDREVLNEMFRDAHSLKGLSAMLGFEAINKLTHRIENVFDAARRDSLGITRELTDLMFQAFDHLTTMVDNLKQSEGGQADVDYEPLVEQLQQLIEKGGVAVQDDNPVTAETVTGPDDAIDSVDSNAQVNVTLPASNAAEADRQPVQTPHTDLHADAPADPMADVRDEANIPEKYLAIFVDETEQALDELGELLERYSEVPAKALTTIGHRIKGAAASIGLNRIAKLVHTMEDALQECHERGGAVTENVAEAMLLATDSLRNSVETLRQGSDSEDDFSKAFEMLTRAREALATESDIGDEPLERIAQLVPKELIDQPPPGTTVVVGKVWLRRGLPMADVKAKMILERLAALGDIVHRTPTEDQAADGHIPELIEFALVSSHPVDLITTQIDLDGVDRIDMQSLAVADDQPTDDQPTEGKRSDDKLADDRLADDKLAADKPVEERNSVVGQQVKRDAAPRSPWDLVAGDLSSSLPIKAAETTQSATGASDTAESNVAAAVSSEPESNTVPPPVSPAPPAVEKPAGVSQGGSKERPSETLRVDIERLDQLMNLSGQLVINKAQFSQLTEQLKGISARKQSVYKLSNATAVLDRMLSDTNTMRGTSTEVGFSQQMRNHILQVREDLAVVERDLAELCQTRNTINDLCEAVHQLDRVTDGIQKSVMDTRMVPVGPLFSRFKRVVRDVTRVNGKDIALEIRGEKTELDKRMIDSIADPLIHMVRNSADHGVEATKQRRAMGKPPRGKITLDAFHRGNRVFIQVRDDGQGLNPAKLRDKAIAKGIISAQEAERLTDLQCLQLIWEPGFSTAEQVTEVSGRGMGMDIVRSKIEQLSGTVELDSQVGVGTTITIKLPLTMAILPSLLTVVSSDVFAIPLESVKEIVRVNNKDLSTVRGINTATVRGRVISLVELRDLFHWNSPVSRSTIDDQEHTLVIVGADGDELGLAVDQLLGEEDIVIKSLAENYRNVEGLAGASILGDGRVSLILDVAALLSLSCRQNAGVETEIVSPNQ